MRITKLLGLSVVLVALAVVINALAFKSATVTNPTSFTVSSTTSAALSFSDTLVGGATRSNGVTVDIVDRQLSIDFTDNFQPNSRYRYLNVFNVGKAAGIPDVTLGVDTSDVPTGVTVNLYKAGGGFGGGNQLSGAVIDGVTNTSYNVDMEIIVDATYAGVGGAFDLVITGTQAN